MAGRMLASYLLAAPTLTRDGAREAPTAWRAHEYGPDLLLPVPAALADRAPLCQDRH